MGNEQVGRIRPSERLNNLPPDARSLLAGSQQRGDFRQRLSQHEPYLSKPDTAMDTLTAAIQRLRAYVLVEGVPDETSRARSVLTEFTQRISSQLAQQNAALFDCGATVFGDQRAGDGFGVLLFTPHKNKELKLRGVAFERELRALWEKSGNSSAGNFGQSSVEETEAAAMRVKTGPPVLKRDEADGLMLRFSDAVIPFVGSPLFLPGNTLDEKNAYLQEQQQALRRLAQEHPVLAGLMAKQADQMLAIRQHRHTPSHVVPS